MKRTIVVIAITVLCAVKAHASDSFCFEEAGQEYRISPQLLWAIGQGESGMDPRAVNWNKNGTYDFGVMQINSNWRKSLGDRLWNQLGDPCVNIKTGAWILSQCIRDYGYTWKAVGCYNSRTPGKNERYAARIYRILARYRPQMEQTPQQVVASVSMSDNKETTPWDAVFGHVDVAR